jgi:hypothetical protein
MSSGLSQSVLLQCEARISGRRDIFESQMGRIPAATQHNQKGLVSGFQRIGQRDFIRPRRKPGRDAVLLSLPLDLRRSKKEAATGRA